MTTFFINIFHQKAKNPRKLPIYPKFDVPKVPEVYRRKQMGHRKQMGQRPKSYTIQMW